MLRLDTPRRLTQPELAVRAMLEGAAKVPLEPDVLVPLENLQVIAKCECGCDSVEFAEHDPQRPSRPIADATGKTPAGGVVGIIIWGTDDAVTALRSMTLAPATRTSSSQPCRSTTSLTS